jgi:iron complex transport system substrate-binding protein
VDLDNNVITGRKALIGAVALALVLSACQGAGAEAEGETHEVEDALGTSELPSRPERIVADSVDTYAVLASLGVAPVGAVIPIDISTEYIDEGADDVTNVAADDGWTIDLEHALTLDPEVIVAVGADYNQDNCTRYKAAMPTYCYVDLWEDEAAIKEKVRGVGAALGRSEEAEEAVAAYEERATAFIDRFAESDFSGLLAGVVRFDAGGFIGVRTGDLVNNVLAGLGLEEPEWPPLGDSGYVELSLETLDVLNAADILFVTTDDNVVIEELDVFSSPFWLELEPVVDGNAHFVSAWNGYDLLQLRRIIEDVEGALLG